MALSDPFVVADEAAADHNFVLTSVNGNQASRIDEATSLSTPTRMVVNHTTSGKGDELVDRHLLQFSQTELDANDIPFTTVVNLTMAVPRKSPSNATLYDLVMFVSNTIGAAAGHGVIDDITQGQS